MRHALLILAAAAGCATTNPFHWEPVPADTRGLAAKYPHAVAVLLDRDERVRLDYRPGFSSMIMHHDVVAILSEGGDHWAEVAVPVGNATLSFLHARTIDADGHVAEVTPEEVHTATAHMGGRIDGAQVSLKLFRVPGAHVGSIVEYSYGLESQGPPAFLRGPMSASIPTEHYHLEVEISGAVDIGVRVYNARAKVDKKSDPQTQWFVVDQRDIPAKATESFAPPATVTDPWWTVVVTRVVMRNHLIGLFDTWSHALSVLALALSRDKVKDYIDAAALKPNLAGCGDNRRCAAERALVLVNSKTALSGFVSNLFAVRPLKEVLASGTANNIEKAVLLRSALVAAGVHANLAALARDLDVDFDPDFPAPGRADHLIVFVERQPGFDTSLFIDPSCESCAIGEIPEWSRDRQVLVFGKPSPPTAYRQVETPVTLTRVDGPDPSMSVHKQLIDATLDAEGGLRGSVTDEWQGAQALDFQIRSRGWSADEWQRQLADDLHARIKTAQPGAITPMSWDKREAHASVRIEYRAPGFAASDRDRLVVPLSFLRMGVDRDLSDEPRRHDVMVRAPVREEETMTFHLPAGWVARDLPTPQVWHSDAADGLVEVTSAPGHVTIRRILQTHVGHWGPGEFDDLAGVMRKLSGVRAAAFTVAHGQ